MSLENSLDPEVKFIQFIPSIDKLIFNNNCYEILLARSTMS